MEHKIIVAGIGPGAKEYVIPMAMQAINEAKVLVGGTRALNEFSHQGQKTFAIKADISAVMDFIKVELNDNDVVVMMYSVSTDMELIPCLSRKLRMNWLPTRS